MGPERPPKRQIGRCDRPRAGSPGTRRPVCVGQCPHSSTAGDRRGAKHGPERQRGRGRLWQPAHPGLWAARPERRGGVCARACLVRDGNCAGGCRPVPQRGAPRRRRCFHMGAQRCRAARKARDDEQIWRLGRLPQWPQLPQRVANACPRAPDGCPCGGGLGRPLLDPGSREGRAALHVGDGWLRDRVPSQHSRPARAAPRRRRP
mmetsp:Transcript_7898/g.18917  ORF Transcript_7898/g.18917 Transcript_7898/m.18917 type:complete len:205 (-) Transcript_7898:1922-2536(-)